MLARNQSSYVVADSFQIIFYFVALRYRLNHSLPLLGNAVYVAFQPSNSRAQVLVVRVLVLKFV